VIHFCFSFPLLPFFPSLGYSQGQGEAVPVSVKVPSGSIHFLVLILSGCGQEAFTLFKNGGDIYPQSALETEKAPGRALFEKL
jgi:hypothetical protein